MPPNERTVVGLDTVIASTASLAVGDRLAYATHVALAAAPPPRPGTVAEMVVIALDDRPRLP